MTKAETREHIINTARTLFAQHGFADTGMNAIVDASGISKGGIYWHFKSKNEIVEAVYKQFFGTQIDFIEPILNADGTVSERLLALARMAGEAMTESPDLPHPLDFYAYALRNKTLLQLMSDYLKTYLQHLSSLIQQGIDNGEFVACDADEAALVLISALDGIILVAAAFVSDENISEKLELTVTLFLQGLQKR